MQIFILNILHNYSEKTKEYSQKNSDIHREKFYSKFLYTLSNVHKYVENVDKLNRYIPNKKNMAGKKGKLFKIQKKDRLYVFFVYTLQSNKRRMKNCIN